MRFLKLILLFFIFIFPKNIKAEGYASVVNNIAIPSGNETGVIDEFWLPGGKTSGGVTEAVIDLPNKNLPYEVLNK